MFEGLKKKIAHFIIKKKYLRRNIGEFSFNNVISNARDLLFLMPKDDKDFISSLEILKYYQIHKKVITLFLPEHKYNIVPEKEKYKFVPYSLAHFTKLNLPNKNLIHSLNQKEFEVVVDLNRSEDVFFSAVANVVKSKIRVSFEKEFSGGYYNMQIVDKNTNPEVAYRSFLNYLRMF
ncbi:MAG: hypothetical protein NTX65_05725 [Ignavibacteriales bacterium]|nr:hypothetical protein [Ignavibacteriales bacterium]